jgi:hypothetical protein
MADGRVADVKRVDRLQLGWRWRCGVSAVLWIDVESATEKLQEVLSGRLIAKLASAKRYH